MEKKNKTKPKKTPQKNGPFPEGSRGGTHFSPWRNKVKRFGLDAPPALICWIRQGVKETLQLRRVTLDRRRLSGPEHSSPGARHQPKYASRLASAATIRTAFFPPTLRSRDIIYFVFRLVLGLWGCESLQVNNKPVSRRIKMYRNSKFLEWIRTGLV